MYVSETHEVGPAEQFFDSAINYFRADKTYTSTVTAQAVSKSSKLL